MVYRIYQIKIGKLSFLLNQLINRELSAGRISIRPFDLKQKPGNLIKKEWTSSVVATVLLNSSPFLLYQFTQIDKEGIYLVTASQTSLLLMENFLF